MSPGKSWRSGLPFYMYSLWGRAIWWSLSFFTVQGVESLVRCSPLKSVSFAMKFEAWTLRSVCINERVSFNSLEAFNQFLSLVTTVDFPPAQMWTSAPPTSIGLSATLKTDLFATCFLKYLLLFRVPRQFQRTWTLDCSTTLLPIAGVCNTWHHWPLQ